MKTIEDSNYTIVINKSKFICELLYINNQDEIDSKLKDIKHKYKGATHYCYAYIYDNNKRFNDNENLVVQLVCLF
ncbi:MAG: YigZ family protein [Bacilli bacterium]